MNSTITFGFINHNPIVHQRFLGPSLEALQGSFQILYTSDVNYPAHNYNTMLRLCQTPYLLLLHQDVSFSSDFVKRIELTISSIQEPWGALGLVGPSPVSSDSISWSNKDQVIPLCTSDCCLLLVKTSNEIIFDEDNFGEYHLYVEDYCARLLKEQGLKTFSILVDGDGIQDNRQYKHLYSESTECTARHHNWTVSQRGFSWGRYNEFKQRFNELHPGFQTT